MLLALAEAHAAAQAGEVPVGAALFQGERVVAVAQNRMLRDCDPTAHAEVVALRLGAKILGNYRLPGCTLFCTLEPCAMCAGAIVQARLERLVFGALDPKAGAAGSVLSVLNHPELNHRLAVRGEVLGGECGAVLRAFFRERRMRP